MPIFLILSAIFSSFVFYSGELSAVEGSQIEEVIKDRQTRIMGSLMEVYPQMIPIFINQKDKALEEAVSKMKNCVYKDTLTHRLKGAFSPTCTNLITIAREEEGVSYFLLKKAIEEQNLKEERKQVLMTELMRTKSTVLTCECKAEDVESTDFIIKHEYNLANDDRKARQFEICESKGYGYTGVDSVKRVFSVECGNIEHYEQEEEEALSFVQSQMKTCALEGGETVLSDSFSCKALAEKAKKVGLSYFQMRYVLEKALDELEDELRLQQAGEQVSSEENEGEKQVAKP